VIPRFKSFRSLLDFLPGLRKNHPNNSHKQSSSSSLRLHIATRNLRALGLGSLLVLVLTLGKVPYGLPEWSGETHLTPESIALFTQVRAVKTIEPGQVVRLHVVAHSDCPREQALKNDLAGALESQLSSKQNLFTSRRELLSHLRENLGELDAFSRDFLACRGIEHPVSVSLSQQVFPAREYAGMLLLPPGEYTSLQISIGSGKGENWWCLLFPPLCFHVFPAPPGEAAVDDASRTELKGCASCQETKQEKESKTNQPEIRFWFLERFFPAN